MRSADVELVVVPTPEDARLRGDLEGLGFQPNPFWVDDLRTHGTAFVTELNTDAHATRYGYFDSEKSRSALLEMLMKRTTLAEGAPSPHRVVDCAGGKPWLKDSLDGLFTVVELHLLTRDRFQSLTQGWGVPTFCMPAGRRRATGGPRPPGNSVKVARCKDCQAAKGQSEANGGPRYGVRCNAHAK